MNTQAWKTLLESKGFQPTKEDVWNMLFDMEFCELLLNSLVLFLQKEKKLPDIPGWMLEQIYSLLENKDANSISK